MGTRQTSYSEEMIIMNWEKVKSIIADELLKDEKLKVDDSQKRAILKAADMLVEHGVILADEVGLGKTRVALVVMEAVLRAGGTVAAVVPPGLIYQWENEAKSVFKEISGAKISQNIILLRHFSNLFENENFPLLNSKKANFVIASQKFGFLEGMAKRNEHYDLFTLIKILSFTNLRQRWKDAKEKIEKRCSNGVKNAAEYLAENKKILEHSTWKKFTEPPSEKFNIRKDVFETKDDVDLALKCIGKLIGNVDLLVIDEAHKSREGDDENEKNPQNRLTLLLENIIVQGKCSRRFCMTATPIELRSSQWNELFSRCKLPAIQGDDNFIEKFDTAHVEARANYRNKDALKKLINASKVFTNQLSKYVIRRKRTNNQKYCERIRSIGLNLENAVKPHVEIKHCFIDPGELKESQLNWKKAIYCFEGMSLACQGMNLPPKTKLMRCRYAAGLVDFSDYTEEIDKLDNGPQKERIKFWYERSKEYAKERCKGEEPLYGHPRVLKAAKEIYDCVKKTGEKVLVFGTFTEPILFLRNTLNALYIIDCMLANPCKPTTRMGLDYKDIWEVYQQFHNMLDFEKVKAAIEACERENNNRTARLNDNFSNGTVCEGLGLSNLDLSDEEKQKIGERIRSDLAEALRDERIERLERVDARKKEQKIFDNICSAYVKGSTDQLQSEFDQSECDDDDASNRKDKIFDALGLGKDKNMSRRHSAFCRLMDGNMKMSTRRIVQELFNNEDAFPKVLIAQSTVGREGLNLQEACRNIFIFHPEWNPAVIEQEIGRVDRIGSLWEKMVDDENRKEPCPKITVTFVVFRGTYDEYQYRVYESRKNMLDSQLSGVLLGDKDVPEEYRTELTKASPNFEPK